MAHMSLSQYMDEVYNAIQNQNGEHWARLISHKDPHVASHKLQVSDAFNKASNFFDPPLDDMIANHLRAVWAVSLNNYTDAYEAHVSAIHSFIKVFQTQKDENWALPVLYSLALDLRQFAISADSQHGKNKTAKQDELLEKSAEHLMSCFRVCVSDTRASLENSKKWGMLAIVNQLFKIYFRINKLQLCKPLRRAVDSLPIKDQFPKAHLVTYRYFVGKKAMFDSDYKLADEYLSYSFERCHRECKKNKRNILIYLLPVKMLLGKMPNVKVLKRYSLLPFSEVRSAVIAGDLLSLSKALDKHQAFFIRAGIYLILEKLKIITYRNLFKKTALILGTHQLPIEANRWCTQSFESLQKRTLLQAFSKAFSRSTRISVFSQPTILRNYKAFRIALHHMGQTDVDTDEVHCIIANLIYEGYIKGYISLQHQKLIISKQNPFPSFKK